jgi:hypothetical protein
MTRSLVLPVLLILLTIGCFLSVRHSKAGRPVSDPGAARGLSSGSTLPM